MEELTVAASFFHTTTPPVVNNLWKCVYWRAIAGRPPRPGWKEKLIIGQQSAKNAIILAKKSGSH